MAIYCVTVRNVNEALGQGISWLAGPMGVEEPSRNGPVRVSPYPVVTTYANPAERVLFSPMRDANPFFHLFEALWMLAGRNDLPWLVQFNKRFATYSDDGGQTQPGAYGYRWREYFGYDQLNVIIDELKSNPTTRRAVLAMWDGGQYEELDGGGGGREHSHHKGGDLAAAISGSADVPCNTHAYFRVNGGKLDLTVLCRSNDILWGAYGANAVHFSVLLEYVSIAAGIPMGQYHQFSNNYHYYTEVVGEKYRALEMAVDAKASDHYRTRYLRPMPLMMSRELFDVDLQHFMRWEPGMVKDFTEPMFREVAVPMRLAWAAHKEKDYKAALAAAYTISAPDWRQACIEWLERRELSHLRKQEAA